MSNETTKQTGANWSSMAFLVLLVLKLTHTIDWSWWWITLPLWGGLAFLLLILCVLGIIAWIASK